MRLRSRFLVVTLALGWLDSPASLRLGLVSRPLRGPALGLASVHPGLPAYAHVSVFTVSSVMDFIACSRLMPPATASFRAAFTAWMVFIFSPVRL